MKKQGKFFVKAVSGFLAVMLVLALAGCSGTSKQEPPKGYSFMEEPDEEQIYSCTKNTSLYVTTDPQEIADHYSDLIVAGKFLGNTDVFIKNGFIYTCGLFEVGEVFKGSYDKSYIEAVYSGGVIPMDEYIQAVSDHQVKKCDLDQVPEAEREDLYMEQRDSQYGVKLESGENYALLLKKIDGKYVIQGDCFGALPYHNERAYCYTSSGVTEYSFEE